MPSNDDAKSKSKVRFKQINHLVDNVFSTLKTPTHALVLVVGWRDADIKGRFSMSYSQIAKVVGISRRQVLTVVNDLINDGWLRVIRETTGRRPPVYMLCFKNTVVVKRTSPQEITCHPAE